MNGRLHILFGIVLLSVVGCGCLSTSKAQDGPASPATTRQTQVIVTVTDTSGRYMGGLHKGQVTMLDNGVPQEVLTIEESTFPVSIGLLFNVSRGRYRDSLALTRKTILSFFDAPQKTNEYFIMGFDKDSFLATDWTRKPEELISGFDKLASAKPSKSATRYDALEIGLKKMRDARYFKRALIMVSDIDETGSKLKLEQLLEALRRSDVLVYSISVDTSILPQTSEHPVLDRICTVSGGFAKSAKSTAQFLDLMEIISLELKHQYLISFRPRGAEGDWHRLSFEVKPLMLHPLSSKKTEKVPLLVRSREGYYPSP
jgi:Ca-activated chloride channel family protein